MEKSLKKLKMHFIIKYVRLKENIGQISKKSVLS